MLTSPCMDSPVGKDHVHKMDMVTIPAGEFIMGGIAEDKFVSAVELPPQKIIIPKAFSLGKTSVTQGQWNAVMDHSTQSPTADLPVVNVSYHEALSFIERLSHQRNQQFRLPSEAEWEYACRAGSTTVFPHGTQLTPMEANFLYDESGTSIGIGHLTPVGNYPANAFGLHDLLGNVCEWTADAWHPNHHGVPTDAKPRSITQKTSYRTIRGGAWDHLPRVLRPSWRDWAPEATHWDNLGFRLACDL